jgi:DNA primase
VNNAFIPGTNEIQEYDNWGIIKHQDSNYLIPAACEAYRELQKTGEDPYEVDRPLTFIKPSFDFKYWANLMQKVYQDKGTVGIAYVFLTVFRDVIFDVDNNCPHLYGFGERTAGKSKWAESIGAMFFHNRAAFNLNSGTDFAFFDYMSRFRNTTALLNEFDEKVIKEEWFQAIKGIFDGESRQRGKISGNKRGTETMHVKSTLVLTGQYLCTMDDNSIVSRSIIEAFSEREFTEQDKKNYEELKAAEGSGITGLITEVMKFRTEFKAQYKEVFNDNLSRWRKEINTNEVNFNQRIMQNWCHLYSSYQIMSKYLALPVGLGQFYEYCKEKAIYWSNFIRQSDTLSDFWNTLPFLLDKGDIEAGWDFKIEEVLRIHIRVSNKEEKLVEFTQPTKILHIRLNNVHKYYEQAYRSRTGKSAMTLENLLHYFSARKYYVGSCKQSRFTRYVTKVEEVMNKNSLNPQKEPVVRKVKEQQITSSHVFLYDALGVDIDRLDETTEETQNLPFP